MMIKKIPGTIVLCCLLFISVSLHAQKKYEREYSLKTAAVPKSALAFVDDVFKGSRVRWYGEESLTGTTIEAKLKHGGKQYSVEFSKEGSIQDIEILSSFSRIPGEVKKEIEKALGQKFKSYKVVKTQLQWTASEAVLKKAVVAEKLPAAVILKYELVIRGKQTGVQRYYEVLCDAKGAIENVREIIQRNADNLMY